MQSIGQNILPIAGGDQGYESTDIVPLNSSSRFMTPRPRDTMSEQLVPTANLKYMNAGKMEKETIKDYIGTTRHMLRKNLTNEARKRDLSEVS